MRRTTTWSAVLATAMMVAIGAAAAQAQGPDSAAAGRRSDRLIQSNWSGPRMGLMIAPGDDAISRRLRSHGLGGVVSEFGWHFEHRVSPYDGGPQLVTEFVPLLGGVEYGKMVPTFTAAMGMRFRSGYEFGMGPSLTLAGVNGSSTGLVIAVGKSLDYGQVCLPLNLAVSTNPKGTMVTLIVGYAINQKAR